MKIGDIPRKTGDGMGLLPTFMATRLVPGYGTSQPASVLSEYDHDSNLTQTIDPDGTRPV